MPKPQRFKFEGSLLGANLFFPKIFGGFFFVYCAAIFEGDGERPRRVKDLHSPGLWVLLFLPCQNVDDSPSGKTLFLTRKYVILF